MKTNIFLKMFFLVGFFFLTIALSQIKVYGQENVTDVPAVTQTDTPAETIEAPVNGDFAEYFVSIGGLAALTLLATQWIKKIALALFKYSMEGNISGYASWVIALLLSGVGFWLQWGIFVGVTWYYILIYGVLAGLVANGIFKIEHVKTLFEVVKLLPKKKAVETKF